MSLANLLQLPIWLLSLVGLAALALGFMLATPLTQPPPLASIQSGAMAIAQEGKPELSRFQARDGTWLGYRLYPGRARRERPAGDPRPRLLGLLRRNACDRASARRGRRRRGRLRRARPRRLGDARRHRLYRPARRRSRRSRRALRAAYPKARLTLIGHSSGGGFALRVAAGPLGAAFDRFVLLAPYLGYQRADQPPGEGTGLWAAPDIPRIIAIMHAGSDRHRLAAIAARHRLRQSRPKRRCS